MKCCVVNFPLPKRDSTIEDNISLISKYAEEASSQAADIIVFPELVVNMFDNFSFEKAIVTADTIPGNITDKLGEIASNNNLYIIAGMLEKKEGKFYNSAVLIDKNGKLIGVHRKTHLVPRLPNTNIFLESKILMYGNSLDVFSTPLGNFGISICYEYAFSEPMRVLALKGAEIIFFISWIPLSVDVPESVWEARLCTRAADNLVYLAASNYGRPNYGRSIIIDPRGYIIADSGPEPGIIFAPIDLKWVRKIRSSDDSLNFLMHRRPELYKSLIKA
jgi:predicted amidohydrolase